MSDPEPIQNRETNDELNDLDARLNELEAETDLNNATSAYVEDEAEEQRTPIVPFTRMGDNSNAGLLSAEWVKFFIFLLIIGVTLLTIRALRPLIFDQIVPSVLGLDQPRETIVLPEPGESNSLAPAGDENAGEAVDGGETGSGSDTTAGQTENAGSDSGSNEQVEEAQNQPAANINREQAEQPTGAPGFQISHVVQPGETLISIGEKYDISPVVLATANNLPNPNQIQVGATIIIPTGEISGK